MLKLVSRLAWTTFAAALAVASAYAAFPERPITLIVPWGADGGAGDPPVVL
jgi:tripartite-type tricarboxylate transporter receptor subunit TctC